ncbi:MAG: 16S rRNA processing protein RimM [Bacilli bacterium]|nr:16S rRNA processing protein RimM [Bacilli bacterium]
MSKYLETGKIVGVFGLKGELKVISDSTTNRFFKGSELYLGRNIKNLTKVTITSARVHKGMYMVTINELYDINLVEKYVNQIFYIDREEMDDLEENEYYFDDLIGLKIIDGNNNEYGEVVDVLDLPSSAVIEIKLKNDKKIMIPFVGVYINDVTKEYILIERIEEFL